MRKRASLFLSLFFLAAGKPGQQLKPSGEHWYEYLLGGKKVGYMVNEEILVRKAGKQHLQVTSKSLLKLKRLGEEISMEAETKALSTLDFGPCEFTHVSKDGSGETTVQGKVQAGKLTVKHTVGGIAHQNEVSLPEGTMFSSALGTYLKDKLKPAFSDTFSVIVEELGTVSTAQVEFEGKLKVTHRGKQITVAVLRGEFAGIRFREWVDENGVSVYTELPTMGMVCREVDKEEALQFGSVPDLFLSSLINVPTDLPHPESISWMEVKLVFKNRDVLDVPELFNQKILEKGRGFVKLRTTKVDPFREASKGLTIPIKEKSLEQYLKPTPYEQSESEDIRKTAREVVGDETDPVQAAVKLTRFVYSHIKHKNLSKSYSSAAEVLKSRTGDCTEHSVLMAALAKAAGIPARLANGLVYSGGAFGYHEWVEIWAGKWIPFDPTFGETFVDATHIALAQGSSDAEGILSFGKVAAASMQNVEMEIISYGTEFGE